MQVNKKMKKVLAGILIFVMTFANMAFVGKSAFVYAADVVIEKQNSKTTNENIEFDAYFLNENKEKTYSIINDVNSSAALELLLKVKNAGYLKDATIQFKSTEDNNLLNYKVMNENIQIDDVVQSFENNKLKLKLINNKAEDNLINIPIEYNQEDYINLNKISQNSKVILNAIYVDNKGKEINIEKEIILNIGWKDESKILIESSMEKYVPYNVEEKSGVILQTLVKVSTEERKNALPIEETTLEIDVPKIDGVEISKVQVVAKSTEATDGNSNEMVKFNDSNWNYDSKTNKINIKVENAKKEDGTYYSKIGVDEFVITYTYAQDEYNKITEQNIGVDSLIKVKIKRYSATDNKEITNTVKVTYDLSQKIGDLVSYEMENSLSEISKGYIYANYNKTENLYETEFNTKAIINVSYKDMIEEIVLKDVNQYFLDKNENKYDSRDVYYKELSFNKENLIQIIGKEGIIEISDEIGNVIEKISNIDNLKINDNGNYIVKFDDKVKNISIKLSKPLNEGNISINIVKAMETVSYEKEISKNFVKIVSQTELLSKYNYVDEYVNISKLETVTNLNETITDARLYINKEYLSTLVRNDNVEMRIELNNNVIESDIYGNSTFEIVLPSYIENIEISEAKVVYGEGLEIDVAELTKVGDNLIIKVTLKGIQKDIVKNTNLSDGTNILTNGTNIVFNTKIDINMFTPSKEDEIKLYYTNNEVTNYKEMSTDGYGYNTTKIEYSAPTGLVAINGTKNYNEKETSIYAMNDKNAEDIIEILTTSKVATMEMLVMNNNKNEVSDINILGRFPFKGNKKVISNEDLKTTVNTVIKTAIIPSASNISNVTIYYSENAEATKDIANIENGWTTDLSKIAMPKSYLIVTDKMEPSEILKFEYQYEIPENLEHNNNIYSNFAVFYANNTDVATLLEVEESDIVGLTTGEGPELNLELASNVDTNVVKEHQEIVYTAKVTNKGDLPANDVIISMNTPKYTNINSYYTNNDKIKVEYLKDEEKIKFTIKELASGTDEQMNVYVNVKNLPTIEEYYSDDERFSMTEDGEYCLLIPQQVSEQTEEVTYEEQIISGLPSVEISAKADLTAKDLAKTISSEEVKKTIQEAEFSITETTEDSNLILKENKEVEFDIVVNNLSSEEKSNVITKTIIPEGLKYKEAYIVDDNGEKTNTVEYDNLTREVKWNIGTVEGNGSKQLKLRVITDNLKDGITKTTLYSNSVVYADSTESYTSNTVQTNIGRASLVINQTTNVENTYIKEGETLKYIFTIKNEGTVDADDVVLTDMIPEGVKAQNIEVTSNGTTSTRTISGSQTATLKTSIAVNEIVIVEVSVITANLNGLAEKSITNYATVSATNISEIRTNSITHIIEADNDNSDTSNQGISNGQNSSSNNSSSDVSNNNQRTYKLSGTAWLDENENGMRDNNESKISGIVVKLINSNTNSIEKETITNSNGDYTFTGLNTGNYFIVFEYDNIKYGLTEYQKSEIATNVNSDVIATRIEQDGQIKNAAVTDNISINSVSISNIDIGLVNAKEFDLSLNKAVTKITVQTKEGTTSKEFSNTKLPKEEIAAKYISGSTVLIEYTISITNEGDIAGTASKIVDYLPEGMVFNSALNPNWYSGSDGNIYTSELERETILPGETVDITLVLTKTMTESNQGMVYNEAEIYEDYNVYGVADKDSIAGNRAQGEDDRSVAGAIITVKTGAPLIYASIIITSLMILGVGIFVIKTQVISKKKRGCI